jgi:hypothetical protein
VKILKNNKKNSFYLCTRHIENSPTARLLHLGLVRQINPYKTRSLISYFHCKNSEEIVIYEASVRRHFSHMSALFEAQATKE